MLPIITLHLHKKATDDDGGPGYIHASNQADVTF
jgi:hypothetical protein